MQITYKIMPQHLFIYSNTTVLKQQRMEEFCLTLRSKKHFLGLREKKPKPTHTKLQPCTLLCFCVILQTLYWCLEAVAHQPEYRKLLFVEKNRAQTTSFCYFVPACLHLVFPSVRCFSRVNQNPSLSQIMELPQDHQQRLLHNMSHLN